MGKIRRIAAFRPRYVQRIKALFGSSIVAYWPLNETAGSVINDRSGNARNGTYTGATLANAVSLASAPAPLFTGTASYATIYSTAFRNAFPYNEGTVTGFIKTAASFWDGAGGSKQLIVFSNATESWKLYRPGTANTLQCLTTINASVKSSTIVVNPTSKWTHFAITWKASTNSLKFYYNYVSLGVESGTLGTWAGQLTGAFLATLQTSIQFFTGNMSDIAVINREITQAEVEKLKFAPIKKITVLGDSISASSFGWVPMLSQQFLSGSNAAKNRASGGATVITDMSGQVTATEDDNADIIIIALGANDDDAGNMTTFRTAYENGIAALRASNPNAVFYMVNVWPLWEVDLTTQKEKGNIRSTLASIAADQNIQILEPFTEAWYTGAETTDGVHPIASGTAYQSIAANILAGL